jgi:hypothetical protein
VIHALFRRHWEVETYQEQPLSHWNPTAYAGSSTHLDSSQLPPLYALQTYLRWRNAACDCLDILHWNANSVIGAASGMEHTTVLHLHLARVILLTPFRDIVRLAYESTDASEYHSDHDLEKLSGKIKAWVLEDQHKARLAIIHAGALFWHVRRYSMNGFYEPSSVFLASLALWVYGTFARPTVPTRDDDPAMEADLTLPESMQLDRPADDELVQIFVRRGNEMKANILGVGHLCGPLGPERVLFEGCRLLRSSSIWGSTASIVRVLTELAQVRRFQKEKQNS